MRDLGDFRNNPLRLAGWTTCRPEKDINVVEFGFFMIGTAPTWGEQITFQVDGRQFVGEVKSTAEKTVTLSRGDVCGHSVVVLGRFQ